jgi:subtilisin family serine protease
MANLAAMLCRIWPLFLLSLFVHLPRVGAQPYISELTARIWLKDKGDTQYFPLKELKAEAIQRRIFHNFPLDNPEDYPVDQDYLEAIAAAGAQILFASRWLNCVYVSASPGALSQIAIQHSVVSVEHITVSALLMCENKTSQYDPLVIEAHRQTQRMGINEFAKAGFDGRGIVIAVLDAGFPEVDKLSAFAHMRSENRIREGYDFRRKKANPYRGHYHGTAVLSNIGGMMGDQPLGLGTGATYLLALTESNLFEPYREEYRWLAAAEWADQQGAQIINSSLGYGARLYFEEQMDGKTSVVARAANAAARRGILVVNAAGNEGENDDWETIITPADADSVISVGGVDPVADYHISFGSYGPTADKRRKPNVSAYARCTVAKPGEKYERINGTSFSAPLVSGFAACAWQARPGMTNMELFAAIEKSADLYPYYDYAHGYGIPHAGLFLAQNEAVVPTFQIIRENGGYTIQLTENARIQQPNNRYMGATYLYCHIENKDGYLNNYWVVDLRNGEKFTIQFKDLGEFPRKLRAHFNGYTHEIELP